MSFCLAGARTIRFGSGFPFSGICKICPNSYTSIRSMGYEEAQQGTEARTAFRLSEKKYKRYKEAGTSGRKRKGNRHGCQGSVPSTDLDDVLDFQQIAAQIGDTDSVIQGVSRLLGDFEYPVYVIAERPGFYFLPDALTPQQQQDLIQQSLTTFLTPPNQTNHTATLGHVHGLWEAAQTEMRQTSRTSQASPQSHHVDSSQQSDSLASDVDTDCNVGDIVPKFADVQVDEKSSSDGAASLLCGVSPQKLLRKLRWATLGLQFDWGKKGYNVDLPYNPFPRNLAELASKLAQPAVASEGQFTAQAAIVNFYGPDDMLGGHVDDMEADWSKPIVSLSLGCEAIFLLGGTKREETPLAMYLRSGDVVLMAGPARQRFHAVPRIFTSDDGSILPAHLREKTSSPAFKPFAEYIRDSRININVREVD